MDIDEDQRTRACLLYCDLIFKEYDAFEGFFHGLLETR
jgi:hypothetical protein